MLQNLHIAQTMSGDAVVVTVVGEVDISTVWLLDRSLTAARLLSLPQGAMVVDLSAVRFFGAAGLTALETADHNCREQDVTLRIVAKHRAVLRPLEITGLTKTLTIVPTFLPQQVRRSRTTRASRAVIDAARRILLADRRAQAEKPTATMAK